MKIASFKMLKLLKLNYVNRVNSGSALNVYFDNSIPIMQIFGSWIIPV